MINKGLSLNISVVYYMVVTSNCVSATLVTFFHNITYNKSISARHLTLKHCQQMSTKTRVTI